MHKIGFPVNLLLQHLVKGDFPTQPTASQDGAIDFLHSTRRSEHPLKYREGDLLTTPKLSLHQQKVVSGTIDSKNRVAGWTLVLRKSLHEQAPGQTTKFMNNNDKMRLSAMSIYHLQLLPIHLPDYSNQYSHPSRKKAPFPS